MEKYVCCFLDWLIEEVLDCNIVLSESHSSALFRANTFGGRYEITYTPDKG